MIINCHEYPLDKFYFLLTQTIIPRPIAWVISDNGNETYNLAPFSFFNAVSANPPILMLSVGWKDEGLRKDTWVNISERSHFVVHIPSANDLNNVSTTSASLPHGVSEITFMHGSVEKVEGEILPRLKGPKVAFFCEKYAIHEIGKDPQALILGKVNRLWIDDSIIEENKGRLIIDPKHLNPLARLGGNHYAVLGEILTMNRPD